MPSKPSSNYKKRKTPKRKRRKKKRKQKTSRVIGQTRSSNHSGKPLSSSQLERKIVGRWLLITSEQETQNKQLQKQKKYRQSNKKMSRKRGRLKLINKKELNNTKKRLQRKLRKTLRRSRRRRKQPLRRKTQTHGQMPSSSSSRRECVRCRQLSQPRRDGSKSRLTWRAKKSRKCSVDTKNWWQRQKLGSEIDIIIIFIRKTINTKNYEMF